MQVVGGPNDSIIFVTLGVGVCFGEIALLGTGGMNRRTASIKVCGVGCGGDGTCEDDGGGDGGGRIVVSRTVVVGMVVMGMVVVVVVGKVLMEMLVAMIVAFEMVMV